MVRRRNADRVDVGAPAHLAKVVVHRTVGVAVTLVDGLLGSLALARPDVADGDRLHVLLAQERSHQAGALNSEADETHRDSLARRDSAGRPHRRGRNEVRNGPSPCDGCSAS